MLVTCYPAQMAQALARYRLPTRQLHADTSVPRYIVELELPQSVSTS